MSFRGNLSRKSSMQQKKRDYEDDGEASKKSSAALDIAEFRVAIARSNSSNNVEPGDGEVSCVNVKSSATTSNHRERDDEFNNNSPPAYNQVKMKNNDGGVMESLSTCSSDLQSQFMTWLEEKKRNLTGANVVNEAKKVLHDEEVITSRQEVESSKFCDTQDAVIESDREVVEEVAANDNSDDYDEFKDVIEDEVNEDDGIMEQKQTTNNSNLMDVPLFIDEEEDKHEQAVAADGEKSSLASVNDDTLLPLTINSTEENDEKSNVIEAKFTLTSSLPLQIVTRKSLSTSNMSLESSKLPARHNKGPAPPPPGQFYDKDKKKYFKETEL